MIINIAFSLKKTISFLYFSQVLLFTLVHFKSFYIFLVLKIPLQVILFLVILVNENQICIANYETISEEVKYISNSLIRLKILATLYERPRNMKDINKSTGINYSSISSNMFGLELKEYIYRKGNQYFISNTVRMMIGNIIELDQLIAITNKFFNILDAHIIDMIPEESIIELYLLGKAILVESDDKNIYRVYDIIKHSINEASNLKCVLPIFYEDFNNSIDVLINQEIPIELFIPRNIENNFKETLDLEKENLSLATFDEEFNFLLIVTDKMMIVGFFKEDGNFDQNRILTSKKEECIKWGENLFENYKNKINK